MTLTNTLTDPPRTVNPHDHHGSSRTTRRDTLTPPSRPSRHHPLTFSPLSMERERGPRTNTTETTIGRPLEVPRRGKAVA